MLKMAGLIPFNRGKKDFPAPDEFDRFRNMLGDFFSTDWPLRKSLTDDAFKIDVIEEDTQYIVEAEVPGVGKEDINVELNDGRLLISINKNEETETSSKHYVHKERHYSSMSRSLMLDDAKSEGIAAKLDNGLLRITVPREEKPNNSIRIDVE